MLGYDLVLPDPWIRNCSLSVVRVNSPLSEALWQAQEFEKKKALILYLESA